MIVKNLANYSPFVSRENSKSISDKAAFFQNTLNDMILRKNDLASSDNVLKSTTYDNNRLSSKDCAMDNEKVHIEDDEVVKTEEKTIDIFTMCFECENKDECEHYQKMINGDESVEGNATFLPIETSKSFHKNKTTLQEQLYKLTSSSIIYNYNVVCLDVDTKIKTTKRGKM